MDENQPNTGGSWRFVPDEQAGSTATPYTGGVPTQSVAIPRSGADGSITWTASEFIAHHKTAGWYGTLAGGAVLLAGIVWLITKDIISGISIIGAAALLAGFANRPPRELTYRVDQTGLRIAHRMYHFADFESYSIMTEGAFASLVFMPLKRFAPTLTVYYDPSDEQKIITVISDHVPLKPRKADMIDRLMWRIRF